jgi:sensor c-di-GMP phosphodiesterase-like protein
MLESELRNEAMIDQRITFYFKDAVAGEEFAKKALEYINSNPYYDKLVEVQQQSNQASLMSNDSLIRQIDILLQALTQKLNKPNATSEGQFVMENLEGMDVAALLELKNEILADSDIRRMELAMNDKPINILSFGKPHRIDKPLFRKNIVFLPLLLVGLFLLGSVIRFLNRKSEELL